MKTKTKYYTLLNSDVVEGGIIENGSYNFTTKGVVRPKMNGQAITGIGNNVFEFGVLMTAKQSSEFNSYLKPLSRIMSTRTKKQKFYIALKWLKHNYINNYGVKMNDTEDWKFGFYVENLDFGMNTKTTEQRFDIATKWLKEYRNN